MASIENDFISDGIKNILVLSLLLPISSKETFTFLKS